MAAHFNESRLITGPPASGKSRAALDRFLAIPNSTLLTPTSTMAEHIRNQLARARAAVRPSRVITLAKFLDTLTPLAPASAPVVHLLVDRALRRLPTASFAAAAQFRGFHQAVAALIEEAPRSALRGAYAEDLASVFRDVEDGLAARGMSLREGRIRSARLAEIQFHVVFDGFFSFTSAELELIESLAALTPVTVTLPDGNDAASARDRLLRAGLVEQRMSRVLREPRRILFSALSIVQETEEIARRILKLSEQGRAFREIGIVLRARDPYGPALETTLARFGIPARYHFADILGEHPVVQYLAGVMRALLGGWDHAAILTLLRMPASGFGATPEGDRFDFALRDRLPGAGLPLTGIEGIPPLLESFRALDQWRKESRKPDDWAKRLKTLCRLLPEPEITDQARGSEALFPSRDRERAVVKAYTGQHASDQLHIWRSTSFALEAWGTALQETAIALSDAGEIPLARFWEQVEVALSLEPLRFPDRRRNVVNIVDIHEARQWELPVVFVCGLNERHFPQYHSEDPLLRDAARRRAGLKTSVDRQLEERFLFDLATTRATVETVLSYARLNDKGEDLLRSFFLGGAEATPCEMRVRPKSLREARIPAASAIHDESLHGSLRQKHKTLSPTSIESFLQCPFQFFAGKTLRLRKRPQPPRDRLDLLLQGSILHKALAELSRQPLLGLDIFDAVFEEECRGKSIPATYRTEAVRLELLRHFEAFLADHSVDLGWTSRVEEEFSYPLNSAIDIRGRIDRLDVGPGNQALVIDYKHSASNKIKERVKDSVGGNLVQAGLYLLAAERVFKMEPAGMLYCGLRNGVSWDGWHAGIPGLAKVGESRAPAGLREVIDLAAQKTVEVFEAISSGRIAPHPADRDKCRWCDFVDICRVETIARARGAGGA